MDHYGKDMQDDMLDSQGGDTAQLPKSQISDKYLLTVNASAESEMPEKAGTLMDIGTYDRDKLLEIQD